MRFVASGLVVLPLSLGLYLTVVGLGADAHVARILSFVAGTALVAELHRRWTFRDPGVRGAPGWTAALYAASFAVVVVGHGLALDVLPAVVAASWVPAAAWFVSQLSATTLNFLVLRTAVFPSATADGTSAMAEPCRCRALERRGQ